MTDYLYQPRMDWIDVWCRRFVIVVVLPLLLFIVQGCATTPGEKAQAISNSTPTPNYPPLVVKIQGDIHEACIGIGAALKPGGRILGCADYAGRYIPGFCLIFVPVGDPGWIEAHERLHCTYGGWHG